MTRLVLWTTVALGVGAASPCRAESLPQDDGYRGIWYANQPSGDEYRYKYSGGMATYPQQHTPIAVYCQQAHKTFFVYGGTVKGKRALLHMVSYYDHATGQVPRPTILLNKQTDDAHDNPTLQVDDQGHLWVFSNAHGTGRPSYIHKSQKPYAIDAFEQVLKTNFSYSQPWHVPGQGFLFLHTRYAPGRHLFWMTSPDGLKWGDPQPLARVAQGHYQISWREGERVGTAFNYHPPKGGLNARTNLYYLETRDFGRTWRTADGKEAATPLTEVQNPALVRDYQAENLLVYLKDVQFDAQGRPVLLYLTSRGYAAGPAGDPRTWHTARWTGKTWEILPFTTSDHNYDFGSFYIEADGTWRVIAPTEPGPQPYGAGGEMVLWISKDQGKTWQKERQLTRHSPRNHTYARRPLHAHPDFYALWADGDARQPSESHLYFTNRAGDKVWRLPPAMKADFARPEEVVTPDSRPEVIEKEGLTKIRLLPPTPGTNPRNSEGAFIQLKDGRLLFVYTHFTGGGGDHAAAHLASRSSKDCGRTWTATDELVLPNEAKMNVMSVSLLRLQNGAIALFYLRKNSLEDCRAYLRLSADEGKTWGEPTLCIRPEGYYVVNNDRVVQLKSGRLVIPAARHNVPGGKWTSRGVALCFLSDDSGKTWRQGRGELAGPVGSKTGLQEPGVVELKDGKLLMLCRTDQGSQYGSYSADGGDTWAPAEPTDIQSPVSPASFKRIPKTGDLLLVWNDHRAIDAARRGKRTPLTAAISRDEGKTWEKVKTLEDDPAGWYCYTAIAFAGDRVLLAYCAGDDKIGRLSRTQITLFDLDWLYRR